MKKVCSNCVFWDAENSSITSGRCTNEVVNNEGDGIEIVVEGCVTLSDRYEYYSIMTNCDFGCRFFKKGVYED